MDKAELIARYPGYSLLIERGLVGWEPFSSLQPWHYIIKDEMFFVSEKWPSGPSQENLLVFARRQDCDDLACFKEGSGNAAEVVIIEGWSSGSYEIVESFPTFWEWLKSVIDDIADWSSPELR